MLSKELDGQRPEEFGVPIPRLLSFVCGTYFHVDGMTAVSPITALRVLVTRMQSSAASMSTSHAATPALRAVALAEPSGRMIHSPLYCNSPRWDFTPDRYSRTFSQIGRISRGKEGAIRFQWYFIAICKMC